MESFDRLPTSHRRPRFNLTGWQAAWGLAVLLTVGLLGWLFVRVSVRPLWLDMLPSAVAELLTLLEFGLAITVVILWGTLYWRKVAYNKKMRVPAADAVNALTREEMYALSPSEFETFVGNLFRKKGYTVTQRGRTGDLGVDVEVVKDGREAIVQCKRYQHTVGPDVVRELYGTLLHERVSHAFLVTSAEISNAARTWVKQKPITLIDGDTLVAIAQALSEDEATF